MLFVEMLPSEAIKFFFYFLLTFLCLSGNLFTVESKPLSQQKNMSNNTVQMETPAEMLGFLKTNGTECRFVAIISNTPVVKMRKDSPYQGIRKVSKKIGIINANYNKSVRTRLADKLGVKLSEVDYENGNVWYEHLKTTTGKTLPIVQHKDEAKRDGKFYLQYYPHSSTHKYVMANGDIVPDETLKPFLYKESERSDYKPSVIVFELGNICQLKASGIIVEMPDLAMAETILAD